MPAESDPLDIPDDFDALMERLPWSLRTRVLSALRGEDDEIDTNESPLVKAHLAELLELMSRNT